MDAARYKHVVLGLIFLKYISDAFEAKHAELEAQRADGAGPEDPRRVAGCQHLLGAEGGPLVYIEQIMLQEIILSLESRAKHWTPNLCRSEPQ